MTRTAALSFMASLWAASHAYGAAYALEGYLIQMCTCVAIVDVKQGEN